MSAQRFGRFFLFFRANRFGKAVLRFQFMTELLCVQAIIMPAQFQQFSVRALLGDLSILDHKDSVRAPNC